MKPPSNPYIKRIDLTHTQPAKQTRSRVHQGRTVMRDPSTVDGIVIHQTAVKIPPSARLVRSHGGNEDLAAAHRAVRLPTHAVALRRGVSVYGRDIHAYTYHANGLNVRSLGLEVEGKYPGDEKRPEKTTWNGSPDHVTELLIETARDSLKWLYELGMEAGMPLKYVWAHRQSSPSRTSDPGSEIWRRLVLEYAVPFLGLEVQNDSRMKSTSRKAPGWGKTIPVEWDPENGVGRY